MCPGWDNRTQKSISPKSCQSDNKNNKTTQNAPGAGVLPGVADFVFAFARFALGASVDSSSCSGLLEDEEVEEEESLEVDSERVCVVSGTTNCWGSCNGWSCSGEYGGEYIFGWV
jgi:hypothetical protein